jgi:RNA polymerase sigma-70 factor, ECF subfamily
MVEHGEDLALARRVLGGDRSAFDGFFAEFFPRLYRFVLLRVGGDADAAQDVCQQVFGRGLQHLGSYRGEASLFTWLCQIARREVADQWASWTRERARQASYDQEADLRGVLESLEADPLASPEAQQQRSELVRLIQTALDHLPAHYGDVLEWKYVDDLDVAAIAERLSTTAAAAQSLLARARAAFRSEFAALASDLGADEPTRSSAR